MMHLRLFLLYFAMSCSVTLVAQDFTALQQQGVNPSFSSFLDTLLTCEPDRMVKVDSTQQYLLHFVTMHSFKSQSDFHDTLYADVRKTICIANPVAYVDSIVQLHFFNFDTAYTSTTILKDKETVEVIISAFEHKNPQCNDTFVGPIPWFTATRYAQFISFQNGRYMILSERIFGPDIRGSMPPGCDVSYFLERVK